MGHQKKVSIIIPVYGVEQYLEECVSSLTNQTYQNLEIILIDDNSPDRCPQMCDEFAAKDMRVQVIHKNNGGAASARNCGLDILTGDYIAFVDSDDYVTSTYIEKLVNAMEQNDADISICSFEYLYKNTSVLQGNHEVSQVLTQKDYLKRFLNDWTCGIIWNKLFKAELLGSIRFPEGHKIDDEFFTYRLVMNADKVFMFNETLYSYRMRKSSVMNASKQEQILWDKLDYLLERYRNVLGKFPELSSVYTEDLVDSLIRYKRQSKEFVQIRKQIWILYRQYFFIIMLSKISIKKKYSFLRSIFVKDEKKSFDKNRPNESCEFFE